MAEHNDRIETVKKDEYPKQEHREKEIIVLKDLCAELRKLVRKVPANQRAYSISHQMLVEIG